LGKRKGGLAGLFGGGAPDMGDITPEMMQGGQLPPGLAPPPGGLPGLGGGLPGLGGPSTNLPPLPGKKK
ncbi:unnamed protein product, partial [marine sediment metagenome]